MEKIDLTNVNATAKKEQARQHKRLEMLANKQLFPDEDAEFEDLNNPSLDSPHFADRGY